MWDIFVALIAGFIILVTITGNLLVRIEQKRFFKIIKRIISRLYFLSKLTGRSALQQNIFISPWRLQIWLSDVSRCQYSQWSILRNTGHLTGKNISYSNIENLIEHHTRLTVKRVKPFFLKHNNHNHNLVSET